MRLCHYFVSPFLGAVFGGPIFLLKPLGDPFDYVFDFDKVRPVLRSPEVIAHIGKNAPLIPKAFGKLGVGDLIRKLDLLIQVAEPDIHFLNLIVNPLGGSTRRRVLWGLRPLAHAENGNRFFERNALD